MAGRDRPRAIALAKQARADLVAGDIRTAADMLKAIDRWLAAHR
jgi:hypothetical protein